MSSVNRPTITENPQPKRWSYVQGMQHRCERINSNLTNLRIVGREDMKWWLLDPDDYESDESSINFCPFCGEKLPEIVA
jgi:hypothetical protein